MLTRCGTMAATACLLAAAASGQSINVDFGDGAGPPGTPPADYAAASQAGVWNAAVSGGGLLGLDGRPVAATISFGPAGFFAAEQSPASPEHAPLMNDGLGPTGDILSAIHFSDLLPGEYEVIIYAWNPLWLDDLTSVVIDGEFSESTLTGGEWDGDELVEGLTHTTFQWEVVDGSLQIAFAGGVWGHDGAVNGIQLRLVDETIPGDVNGDGVVDVDDLLILLMLWGGDGKLCPFAPPCWNADLNGDGVVDTDDLLILLANWTA